MPKLTICASELALEQQHLPAGCQDHAISEGSDHAQTSLMPVLSSNFSSDNAKPIAVTAAASACFVHKEEFFSAAQVSVVDQHPQELVAAAVQGVRLQYAAGLGPSANCSSLRFSIDSVQIDDEVPGTRCVRGFSCLLPHDAARAGCLVPLQCGLFADVLYLAICCIFRITANARYS